MLIIFLVKLKVLKKNYREDYLLIAPIFSPCCCHFFCYYTDVYNVFNIDVDCELTSRIKITELLEQILFVKILKYMMIIEKNESGINGFLSTLSCRVEFQWLTHCCLILLCLSFLQCKYLWNQPLNLS